MGSRDAATDTGKAYPRVELIPWDPTDEQQFQRLYDQRVACTWDYGLVAEWKGKMLRGQKVLYWVVLAGDAPRRDELLGDHVKRFPKERESLVDTATSIGQAERTPSKAPFLPIGHIAIEAFPERNVQFSLPATTYWALQSSGLGRSAMAQFERIAAAPPFNSTFIALDTFPKAFQLREDCVAAFCDARGVPRSPEIRTTQEWYQSQGYHVVGCNEHMYDWVNPKTGESITAPCVFMAKSLV
ncbi:hypothetical protein TOPH_06549 [Tolypocladium ophioglossoides CBS 100239]|uniref:N-acetyltransferase domain-containing protein n=1 Tax=Tolypocladium ophioglossoides (strain CBS 100239) TaxID=1163406 RepID=A0A0L0N418_TOLOC|nr:hypothetical protein TOPH_06549 [Tolypocladium ophioglossoides CBS 100239]